MSNDYPQGITCMDDYKGCLVKLRRPVLRGDGILVDTTEVLVVWKHWRGRLTLCYRQVGTVNGHGDVAVHQVSRHRVDVIGHKLA